MYKSEEQEKMESRFIFSEIHMYTILKRFKETRYAQPFVPVLWPLKFE